MSGGSKWSERARDLTSCVCQQYTSNVSTNNVCSTHLPEIPFIGGYSHCFSIAHSMPNQMWTKKYKSIICPISKVFCPLALSMKIQCHCDKASQPGTPPIDQREGVRSFLVDYVRMDFYFYFPVLVYLLSVGLILFQFMLTSSINCIILN